MTLGLSACGYPATQYAIRRWGRTGAAVTEVVCAGLALRDGLMIRGGSPGRLRPVPAALLRAEFAVALAAAIAGLRPLVAVRGKETGPAGSADATERVRRGAVAALFALHTVRFAIYLSPGGGRRPAARVEVPDAGPDRGR